MRYLLDTHVWIWARDTPEKVPDQVRNIILNPESMPLGLSAISPWEAAKKAGAGRLTLSAPVRQWLNDAVCTPFVRLLPLSIDIAYESNHLPGEFHRDPADQIIVATARQHDLTLITADRRILAYPHVRTLWG
jgi:PIN domain nuclease of toxin-antitoxin system